MNINSIKEALTGWSIILSCALFYSYQFILRVLPNTLSGEFMEGFAVDAGGFGIIVACYSCAYAGLQLPLGIMLDRIKVRYLLPIAPLICTIASIMLSYSDNIVSASASRFLMGVGAAFGFISTVKVATLILPSKRVSIAIGIVILFGTFGAGFGGKPLQELCDIYGWRETLRVMSIFGVILSAILFFSLSTVLIRAKQKALFSKASNSVKKDLTLILANKKIFILALYGMLMYLPITILGVAWGIGFITIYFGVDYDTAAQATFLLFIGAGLGGPISASFAELIGSKQIMLVTSAFFAFLLYSYILYGSPSNNSYMIYLYFFAAGILYSAKVLTFAMACEIMPDNVAALTTSILNMFVMGAGIVFHPLVGFLLGYAYGDSTPEMYSVADYRIAMSVLPISAGLSVILGLLLKADNATERKLISAENAFLSYDD